MSKKKPLTEEQLAECRAAHALFLRKKNELKISQRAIAEAAGISPPAVNLYFKGINPLNVPFAVVLSKMLGEPIESFSPRLAGEVSNIAAAATTQVHNLTQSQTVATANVADGPEIRGRVPVISWVQAGDFCETIDTFHPGDAEEWVPFAANHSDLAFALRVRGTSMMPRFQEGEVIIVDPRVSADSGRFVVAKKTGAHEATFKQLMIEGGDTYLRALNPDWPEPIIRLTEEWHICGVVIARMELF